MPVLTGTNLSLSFGERQILREVSLSIENTLVAGPYVLVEYHLTGELRRRLGRIGAPDGRLVRLSQVDVYELHDGKLLRAVRYVDPAQIAEARPPQAPPRPDTRPDA